MKKAVSTAMALSMMVGLMGVNVNASAYEAGSYDGVSITMLNTKSELQDYLVDAAAEWGELTGASLDVYTISDSGSPSQEIAARYAANNAPTLIMGDVQDVADICEEYGADLSNESWAANGGETYGVSVDGKLYSFPFCIEGRGLIYNKTAIEETLGEEWDPSSVTNMDDLAVLLEKLVKNGMEYPVALNMEDYALGGHYLTQVYEEQDSTMETTSKFIDDLKAGNVDLMSNQRFTALMDTFDLLAQYNINKDDPLAADYATNCADLAEGEVAIYFNGNWAWAEISSYIEDGTEIGIMPVMQNETSENEAVNSSICGSATKQVMIDKECNDEQQQAAAKDFLNWLVESEEGQSVLIEQCSLIPAFTNIDKDVTNMLAQSVQNYVKEGKVINVPYSYPGDHRQTVGAYMQKYFAGETDRATFATEIQDYWTGLAK